MLSHIAFLSEASPSFPAFVRLDTLMHPCMIDHIPSPLHYLISIVILSLVNSVPVACSFVFAHDDFILEVLQNIQACLYLLQSRFYSKNIRKFQPKFLNHIKFRCLQYLVQKKKEMKQLTQHEDRAPFLTFNSRRGCFFSVWFNLKSIIVVSIQVADFLIFALLAVYSPKVLEVSLIV